MDMKKVIADVNKLADEELERANEVYEQFHSRHEGFAVLREEYQETVNELRRCDYQIEKRLWDWVMDDADSRDVLDLLKEIKKNLGKTCAECIQAMAMVTKMMNFENVSKKDAEDCEQVMNMDLQKEVRKNDKL